MSPQDFLDKIIIPTLTAIGLEDPNADQLLLGTAIQESGLRDVRQVGGPAEGFFQIEPATHEDVWANYLAYKPLLSAKVRLLLTNGVGASSDPLLGNPQYECAIARIIYLRSPGVIPATLAGQAAYYKQYYNTLLGKATAREYTDNFLAVCGSFPCLV